MTVAQNNGRRPPPDPSADCSPINWNESVGMPARQRAGGSEGDDRRRNLRTSGPRGLRPSATPDLGPSEPQALRTSDALPLRPSAPLACEDAPDEGRRDASGIHPIARRRIFEAARVAKANDLAPSDPELWRLAEETHWGMDEGIRPESVAETFAVLVGKIPEVQHLPGEGPMDLAIRRGLEAFEADRIPAAARPLPDPLMRLMAAITLELHRHHRGGPFKLDQRTAARAVGLRPTQHERAGGMLQALAAVGLLIRVDPGDAKKRRPAVWQYVDGEEEGADREADDAPGGGIDGDDTAVIDDSDLPF